MKFLHNIGKSSYLFLIDCSRIRIVVVTRMSLTPSIFKHFFHQQRRTNKELLVRSKKKLIDQLPDAPYKRSGEDRRFLSSFKYIDRYVTRANRIVRLFERIRFQKNRATRGFCCVTMIIIARVDQNPLLWICGFFSSLSTVTR